MIAENAADLYTKVQAIPALSASTGITLGGKAPDPGMTKIQLPAAWVLPDDGETVQDDRVGQLPRLANARLSYLVMLYLPYSSQSDLIANQFPLLEQVIATVNGTDAKSGQRWLWRSYKLVLVNPDRLGYRIEFNLHSILN